MSSLAVCCSVTCSVCTFPCLKIFNNLKIYLTFLILRVWKYLLNFQNYVNKGTIFGHWKVVRFTYIRVDSPRGLGDDDISCRLVAARGAAFLVRHLALNTRIQFIPILMKTDACLFSSAFIFTKKVYLTVVEMKSWWMIHHALPTNLSQMMHKLHMPDIERI